MSTQDLKPTESAVEKKAVVHLNPEISARINAVIPAIRMATNVKTVTFTDALHHLASLGLQQYESQS